MCLVLLYKVDRPRYLCVECRGSQRGLGTYPLGYDGLGSAPIPPSWLVNSNVHVGV